MNASAKLFALHFVSFQDGTYQSEQTLFLVLACVVGAATNVFGALASNNFLLLLGG